jgi:pimeloyl-ACP methyl ester carboxylesterase
MKMKKWLKRISLGIVSLVVAWLIIGFTYEHVSRVVANRKYSPEGEFVDVNGHQLHFLKQGSGSPTVIFESGLDMNGHLSWYKVEAEVSRYATTVSYDRAGVLWSERGNRPKTAKAISDDLAALLKSEGFPKPYIVVGHSLAGLTLRPFITKNAKDIGAIVFVDTSNPAQLDRMTEPNKKPAIWKMKLKWNIDSSLGGHRVMYPRLFPNTNAEDRINTVGQAIAPNHASGILDEMVNLEALTKETRQITSFGNIPLVVITGDSPTRYNSLPEELREVEHKNWMELQADQLNLSTDSRQILAKKSEHYVQIDEPDIVSRTIIDLISKIRN